MSEPLRVLFVDPASEGSDLLVAALLAGGFEPEIGRVASAVAFSEAVAKGAWDVILSDVDVLGFGAPPALMILRDSAIDIPLIVVSDAATEDGVVDMMRAGACDYVRRQNLARLAPAVARALADARLRHERRRTDDAARPGVFAEALQVSEERFRLLVETIPHMVWMAGPDGSVDFLNQRGASVLGIQPDLAFGWEWLSLLHPDDRQRSRLGWEQAVRDERPYSNEYRIRIADGTHRWYLAQAVPLRDADGRITRWIGTWTDVDGRRRAEDRRVHDAALLAQVRDSVIVTDLEGRVTYWNRGATELFGWSAAEMLGQPLATRFPESARDGVIALLKEIVAGGDWSGEFQDYRKDGSRVWIDVRVTTITDAAGATIGVMGVSHDISARKAAEGAMRASEERFRQIAESIHEVFWLTDYDYGPIVYVSPAYEEIWGRTRESLYASPLQWMEAVHEGDRARVSAAYAARAHAGTYDEEYRVVRPDGTIRWVHDRGFPVREDNHPEGRIAGVAEDITERLQLEGQLRQAQKMEAVGQLAGGVAHDFNNLLTVINGYSELLLEALPVSDHQARELVAEIMRAGERSVALTGQLLALSRKQVLAPTVLDVSDVVRGAEKLLRRVIGEDVHLRSVLPAGLGCVVADAGQLEQVLLNLALNARDAMPVGGNLTIETCDVDDLPRDRHRHPGLAPGRYVALEITDSGTGMSEDVKRHLFEPFFTTKDPGKGTGLGLAVVHGFVKQSGGHIEVESEIGRGTTFRIYLPRTDDPAQTGHQAGRPGGALPVGNETILLVEDDDAVRALSKRVLDRCGYRVLESSRGDAAMRLVGSHAGGIDLLMTDVVMPGGGGRLVAEQVQAAYPDTKVLYVSGYPDDALLRNGVLRGDVNFLQKPFTSMALAVAVRGVLDRPIRQPGAA